jgi:hypothetical protein
MNDPLLKYLSAVPSVRLLSSRVDSPRWFVKLSIETSHPLAWRVVQELGHVLNYLSLEERLPTRFYPASPPPYMNGGPEQYLSWIVENTDEAFSTAKAAEWLEGRLPRPVDDLREWEL